MMKTIKILSGILFTILILWGCEKESENQADGRLFVPRIFGYDLLFPPEGRVVDKGDEIAFSGLQYSPADRVKVSWTVNGEEVSSDKEFVFTADEPGDYLIKVEASYDDISISRETNVFVIGQSDEPFVPKEYDQVLLAYVGSGGDVSAVDWDQITHVAFKAGIVTSAGVLDISSGETGRKSEEIVTRAHIKGVPVLLGISGTLSADGWNVYNSSNFAIALADAAKRSTLVQDVKEYVEQRHLDGIDIMMTDIGNDDESITIAGMNAIGSFVSELRTALGSTAIITVTVATTYVHSYYPDLSGASWLNVHAFEDRQHVGPGKPTGQPSGYDYMVTCAELWKTKYPATKLVIGIPAMGLRYLQLDANGNNASWTSFNYLPYRDILSQVPDAYDKEYVDIAEGVYFNGVPLVTQKAGYLKQEGYLGAYLWLVDYDSSDKQTSLANAIFETFK